MSYLIPTEEMSLSEQFRLRKAAVDLAKARGSVVFNMSEANIAVRDPDYPVDFIPAATRAGLAGWLSMPLLLVSAWYSVFADNVPAAITPVVPTNQVWVFYKVSVLTTAGPNPVSALQFRIGAAANLRAHFDLEALYGKLVSDGYFSLPVSYENPDVVTVNVQARFAILVGCRVRLGTFIAEPLQATVV